MQSYDEHISPVLGGNDTLRNEQKRKRHLEAWSLSVTSSDFSKPKTRYLNSFFGLRLQGCHDIGIHVFFLQPVISWNVIWDFTTHLQEKVLKCSKIYSRLVMLLLLASSQTRSLLEIGFGLVFAAMYVDFDLPIVIPISLLFNDCITHP